MREILIADMHRGWPIAARGGVERAAQPAEGFDFRLARVRGLPDVHALEMRAVGVGIPDSLDDREPPGFEQVGRRPHRRVQAEAVADLEELFHREPQHAAMLPVSLVAEGHDGVDPVVAPIELQHHQHAAVALRPAGPGRARQKRRDRRGQ